MRTSAATVEQGGVAVAGRVRSGADGPGGAVDRAGLPPRPHLLGDVRQERREQLEERLEREAQGRLGRVGASSPSP